MPLPNLTQQCCSIPDWRRRKTRCPGFVRVVYELPVKGFQSPGLQHGALSQRRAPRVLRDRGQATHRARRIGGHLRSGRPVAGARPERGLPVRRREGPREHDGRQRGLRDLDADRGAHGSPVPRHLQRDARERSEVRGPHVRVDRGIPQQAEPVTARYTAAGGRGSRAELPPPQRLRAGAANADDLQTEIRVSRARVAR